MKTRDFDEPRQIALAQSNLKDFAPLYEHYYITVFRFVYNRIERREDAEDLTSSVFIKAMANINKYEVRGLMFSAWLYKIAINEVNLFYRSKKTETKYFIENHQLESAAEEIYEEDSKEILLKECLEYLPESDFEFVHLKYFDGFSFPEIAQIYDKSEESLKVKMHRLRGQLKKDIVKLSKQKGIEILLLLSILINFL
jgi:RNA polymerase sigma-70 factor (ECF subfamily)